jgi:hypothetical protein
MPPWPTSNFDCIVVMDDALYIALDCLDGTGQALVFHQIEVRSTAATAIVAAGNAACGITSGSPTLRSRRSNAKRNHFHNVNAADYGISRLRIYGGSRHRVRCLEMVRVREGRGSNGATADPVGGGERSRKGYRSGSCHKAGPGPSRLHSPMNRKGKSDIRPNEAELFRGVGLYP